ncbi:teichoic acid transport system permease protein [Streptacidiphilus sp. BW17]|uniref:ABC transporter permease n=1 Tax=Streptacidiphilus sp. BW17 TaxID=3156274 RepID=UPI00351279DC
MSEGVVSATLDADSPGDPDAGLAPGELAAKYGLALSGKRPPLVEYSRQLWSRRHFVLAFATARLTAAYTSARLGQIWQVMTPLLNAAVYYLVFGMLLHTNRGIQNYIAYLCTGIFTFQFTQSAVLAGTRAISGNLGLIRALQFPRACLPLALTIVQLQELVVSMVVLAFIILSTGEPLTLKWLLVLPVLVLQTVFNAGLAMLLARWGSKTTDLSQLMPFVIRTWMYMSGVFWSVQTVGAHLPQAVRTLLNVNPALVFNELMRYALMDSVQASSLTHHIWLLALGWAVVAGVVGYVHFWRAEEEYGRG